MRGRHRRTNLTIAEEQQNNEVEGVDHAFAIRSALRDDTIVHDLVPIFAGEDLNGARLDRRERTGGLRLT